MTEATRRTDAEHRASVAASQTSRQRLAAALLAKLLARAATAGLPSVAWTIAVAGAGLTGRCDAYQMDQRRQDFRAWRRAVGTWAGHEADVRREYADAGGTVRLIDQWDQLDGVIVTLTADVWAEG